MAVFTRIGSASWERLSAATKCVVHFRLDCLILLPLDGPSPGTWDAELVVGQSVNWMHAMCSDVIGCIEGKIDVAMLPFIVGEVVSCVSKDSVQTMDGKLVS